MWQVRGMLWTGVLHLDVKWPAAKLLARRFRLVVAVGAGPLPLKRRAPGQFCCSSDDRSLT